MDESVEKIVRAYAKKVSENTETLVAKWIEENPKISIEECTLVHKPTPEGMRVRVETRGSFHQVSYLEDMVRHRDRRILQLERQLKELIK